MLTLILIVSVLNLAIIIYLLTKKDKSLETKFEETIEKISLKISEEMTRNRTEYSASAKDLRQEISSTITELSRTNSEIQKNQLDNFSLTLKNISEVQLKNLQSLNETLRKLQQEISETLKSEIRYLQNENQRKLDEIRQTVDEKLQTTLEKRLNESFKTVSSQLENVYKSLGEMNKLAVDVGDLKKVLTNVKARGIFGELQLKNILDDILTKDQYEENAKIKQGQVEFAIKIPSRDEEGKHILLPIDSKFPREDYEKILDAQQNANIDGLNEAIKALSNRIKAEAKDISEKYINPPQTTDFAIMFLPSEGLFAEVLRIPGFFEDIRKNYNVIITGPTTITAILNSLQMGFRTLAIEKRSHEVWKILGVVKKEFQNFGDALAKTKKKLEDATNEIEKAQKRTENIGKKLKSVETIPNQESKNLLELEDDILETEIGKESEK